VLTDAAGNEFCLDDPQTARPLGMRSADTITVWESHERTGDWVVGSPMSLWFTPRLYRGPHNKIPGAAMTTVRLVLLPDGPYEVTGSIELARSDGQPVQAPADKVYLCRCGHSANKPFCDGSHARTGWTEDA
jgi:hypothetical protein